MLVIAQFIQSMNFALYYNYLYNYNYIIIKSQNNKEPHKSFLLQGFCQFFLLVCEKGRKKYFGESFINLNLFDSKDYP